MLYKDIILKLNRLLGEGILKTVIIPCIKVEDSGYIISLLDDFKGCSADAAKNYAKLFESSNSDDYELIDVRVAASSIMSKSKLVDLFT